jgi:hypothetical protein
LGGDTFRPPKSQLVQRFLYAKLVFVRRVVIAGFDLLVLSDIDVDPIIIAINTD